MSLIHQLIMSLECIEIFWGGILFMKLEKVHRSSRAMYLFDYKNNWGINW